MTKPNNEYNFSVIAEDNDDMQRPEDTIEATEEQLAVWQDIYQIAQRRRANAIEEDKEKGDEEEKELKETLQDIIGQGKTVEVEQKVSIITQIS